jgi:hypothetical protein
MTRKITNGEQIYRERCAVEMWQRQRARRDGMSPSTWAYPGGRHQCPDRWVGWVWVAVVIVCALLTFGIATGAQAQTVGLNVVTAHNEGGYRSDTLGVYYRAASGLGGGILRNSYGRTSVHLSQTWELGRAGPVEFSGTVGGITGYEWVPVIPLVALTARVGHHALHLLPNPRGASAINYAMEFPW